MTGHGRCRLFLAAALSASLSPGVARAEVEPRNEVLKMLEARPLRMDFVVLLDTSGAMAKHFEAARKFVSDLSLLAKAGDTIHFIAFNERAGELTVTIRPGNATAMKEALANVKQPHGQYTDLGQGFDAVFDALIRPGYAPLSMIFLITSFCHEPPPGSAYEGDLDGSGPCRRVKISDALKRKASQLSAAGDQQVRTVAVAIDPVNAAGLESAHELFGTVVRTDVAGSALVATLDTMRKNLLYDRAGLQIEQILKKAPFSLTAGPDTLPLQGAAIAEMKLVSASPIPLRVVPKSMRALDGTLRFTLPAFASPVELPPLKAPPPKSAEPAKPEAIALAVKAENLAKHAKRWSPTDPGREVEVELVAEYELAPKDSIEKLIGREPRGEAKVVERVRFDFTPIESASPLLLAPADGNPRIPLSPQSSQKVELLLTSSVAWADVRASCTIGGEKREPITIAPGQSAPLAVVLKNDAPPVGLRLAKDDEKTIDAGGECEVLAITGDGSMVPAGRHPVPLLFTIYWREGYAPSLILGIALAIVLAILIYAFEIRPRLEPPILTGSLVVYDGPAGFQRVTLPLGGRTRVHLHGVAKKDGTAAHVEGDTIVLPGTDTSAEVYAEKYGKKSIIRLRKLEGDGVLFGESKIGVAPVDLRKGRSRFSVGNYHCRIE